MRIAVDLDSTLSDKFIENWVDIYNKKYDDNLDYLSIADWDIASYFKKCSKKECFDILTPEFFRNIPIKHDAKYLIDELKSRGHEVFIVTAFYRDSVVAKIEWIEEYLGIDEKDIIFCNRKYRIDCDVLIDDGAHNFIDEYGLPTGVLKIVVDQPHNQSCGKDIGQHWRIYELSEALNIIDSVTQFVNRK